jgi:transcriptional regulator with XRE-family HTH domain
MACSLLSTRDAALAQPHTPQPASREPHPALALLGATIRTQRRLRRLTQKALAAQTHMDHTYISEIERGQRNVTVLTLLRVAYVLEIPASTLIQLVEKHPELYLHTSK